MSSFVKIFRKTNLGTRALLLAHKYFHLALWVIIVFPIAWIAFVSAFTHPTWVFAMVYLSTLTWTMILITDPGSRLKHFSPYIVQGS